MFFGKREAEKGKKPTFHALLPGLSCDLERADRKISKRQPREICKNNVKKAGNTPPQSSSVNRSIFRLRCRLLFFPSPPLRMRLPPAGAVLPFCPRSTCYIPQERRTSPQASSPIPAASYPWDPFVSLCFASLFSL